MTVLRRISLIILVVLSITVTGFTLSFWFGTPASLVTPATPSITVNDWNIAYRVQGQGKEAVMLLHSPAWSSVEYTAVAEQLSQHYTVYLVDLPGYGLSDKPQLQYSLPKLQDTMVHFIDQFPVKKFHLVGSSLGASLSTLLAADLPNRITSLTLIDPVGFGSEIDQVALVAQVPLLAELLLYPNPATFHYVLNQGWLTDHSQINTQLKDQLYADATLPKASRAKLSWLRSVITYQGVSTDTLQLIDEAASRIQQPVLLLWGEQDHYAPIAQHTAALSLLPQAQYYPIPQSGHFPQLEQPKVVAEHIIQFLQSGS